MAKKKPDYNRGRVEIIDLKKPITLNGNIIEKAIVEIDHINYGLNGKTRKLNSKKRMNFTIKDIEKFIVLLDGEDIIPDDYRGVRSQFSIRINCPVQGRFFDKEFIMIFDIHYEKEDEIHTITLIPGW